jgi:ACS family hexuronate transporter-like MFS transporter
MATPTIARPATSQFRWNICALLFMATVIAYIDRNVLSNLERDLRDVIHWDKVQYSWITASFQAAYAISMVWAGRLTDRFGTRKAFAMAIVLWSVAAMLPGAATSVLTFGIAMFVLGLGEAANFPACIKTVSEWFPRKERALATGIFNSGANAGAILAPLLVAPLKDLVGWRGTFVVTGSTGFIWLIFWLWLYRRPAEHQKVSAKELAEIQSEPLEKVKSVPYSRIIPARETWAFAAAKALSDPIWWFYLFWLPSYLRETFNLDIHGNRAPLVVAYGISTIGSIYGGWLSGFFLRRGFNLNRARKTTLGICAVGVLPVLFAPFTHNLWLVVGLVGLAMAAHQGWSANLFTVPSDLFPKAAVGSVVGFGGMIGSAAGVLFQLITGYVVEWTHSYVPIFIACGLSYSIGLLVMHLLTPKMEPARID